MEIFYWLDPSLRNFHIDMDKVCSFDHHLLAVCVNNYKGYSFTFTGLWRELFTNHNGANLVAH